MFPQGTHEEIWIEDVERLGGRRSKMPTVEEATIPLAVAREWLRKNEVKTIYEKGVGVGTKPGSETTGRGIKGQERLGVVFGCRGAGGLDGNGRESAFSADGCKARGFRVPGRKESLRKAMVERYFTPKKCQDPTQIRKVTLSEQSPIRCRDTSSRHSVGSVLIQNFTRDGEDHTKIHRNCRRNQKLFTRSIHCDLASVVKNHHGIIEQLQYIDQRQAEFQNEPQARAMEERHQP